ncbi:MAG: M20 family metallopeptidase [Bacteroidetes bacterium]|nr:M20 family metallopeptidase [Bacteroidota bacterium]MDE2673118.1 M20 family metallopeptidase [Bacteroidota bacterium]MYF40642.1 amidohydrolase [Rhodothermaceae bacterium]
MHNNIARDIKIAAKALLPRLISLRRTIHQNPELAFEEHATSALVQKELTGIGIQCITAVANTGVIATIRGSRPGPTVLLRADLDGLPIQEKTNLPFASKKAGVMHACGHDMHTASLLGAASILHQLRDRIAGNIRLVFQPAEELLPGGALAMINAGALDPDGDVPAPTYCIAQHVMPSLPASMLGFRAGVFMASSDELYIEILSDGGHAAKPHLLSGDPVLAAAHIVVALQGIVSRHRPPEIPGVLSIGRINADGATNVIPPNVQLEGTLRAMSENWRESAHERIRKTVEHSAQANGTKARVEIRKGYPILVNNPTLTKTAMDAAVSFVGKLQVKDIPLWLASEDFAYFLQQCEGLFYTLGVGPSPDLHTAGFSPDESALEVGAGFMAFLAMTVNDSRHTTKLC